jgi:hypothetical protein
MGCLFSQKPNISPPGPG